jgi:site-specific recombinase XerD
VKLEDRERVDGTRVVIGHRVYYQGGKRTVADLYSAEYLDIDGRQATESLQTTNKGTARRLAIEIQNRLEKGAARPVESQMKVEELADRYFESVKAKGVAPKTEWKYRTDLDKLKKFCGEAGIVLARTFTADDLYRFRKWLADKEYAPKTIDAVLVLTKQTFKWAWRQEHLRDYRLASVTLPKAKARPQPCFTSDQVDKVVEKAIGEEKAAFTLMGYAGLRIGEVEQLRWEDLREQDGSLTMIHVRRGGSTGSTKDKDERFVPVHPKIAPHLEPRKKAGTVFSTIAERTLLQRLKEICKACKFDEPDQYKLHSFRHHFASLCANHHVAYRKALAWLGHSSSDMLDLYYHLHDEDSQEAMRALAGMPAAITPQPEQDSPSKGNSRATGESRIEKTPQVPELQELVACISEGTERGGFEPPVHLRAHWFSKPARSATPAPLQYRYY